MAIPKTNYLKNTIPEHEDEFVEVISHLPLFSNLSKDLLHQLFQYSKFIKLKNGEHIIEQGLFDQEVFVLIHGALSVLLKDETSGEEELIDTMSAVFTLFGERSLLGEQRGASIQADGDVLLLGIDLSSLPDLLDGIDNPDQRLPDEVYIQNVTMYSIFANVLMRRLDRLIRDQYKLQQKIHNFQLSQQNWTIDWLMARIFNQLHSDDLPRTPQVRKIIDTIIKKRSISHPDISSLLLTQDMNTKSLYLELTRLEFLGEIKDSKFIILEIVRELAEHLKSHPLYSDLFIIDILEIEDLPTMSSLSDYLNRLYQESIQSNILSKQLPKSDFVQGLFQNSEINLPALAEYLQKEGWIKNNFGCAHFMYMVCQTCIYAVSDANQIIRDYVKFLTAYGAPQQDTRSLDSDSPAIVTRIVKLQEAQLSQSNKDTPSDVSSQKNVEKLINDLGL